MAHREGIKAYLATVELADCNVLDFGSGTKPVKNYIKHRNVNFVSVDILSHVGADIVANIEKPFVTDKAALGQGFDHAFCMEVLEHTWNTEQVLENLNHNLKEGGVLHLSTPFIYRAHADNDYRRWTKAGIKRLVEEAGFSIELIEPTEGEEEVAAGFILRAKKRYDTWIE